ncbi:MAG: hypothetical protein IJI22_04120 [Bacilli bacterium]|nr:hypothetical protein [Bacilli bacterium]
MDNYKNVKKAYIGKNMLLSSVHEDLENLRKVDDSSLKRYIEISSYLIYNGLSIDMILNTEDDTFANFVELAEEAQKLILESELVRQYVALNEYGRKLSYESKHLEDVLLQFEEYGEKVR